MLVALKTPFVVINSLFLGVAKRVAQRNGCVINNKNINAISTLAFRILQLMSSTNKTSNNKRNRDAADAAAMPPPPAKANGGTSGSGCFLQLEYQQLRSTDIVNVQNLTTTVIQP